jgi:type III restriction enzyme
VSIWKVLTERCGVSTSDIAVATSTRELPKEAQRVSDLAQLRPRHRHLIFNKKFQEGWDDPEAMVAYFDGETKSATRIKQIIGRVIRQPNAKHFEGLPDLNTAWLFLSSPDDRFRSIVESIRKHLEDEYGADPETGEPNVNARVHGQQPGPIPVRENLPELSLPRLVITARSLDDVHQRIRSAGDRPFLDADMESAGRATRLAFDLTMKEEALKAQVLAIGQNIRAGHRDHFRDRVKALSREAFNFLPEDILSGLMFDQSSAVHSTAHEEVSRIALEYVDDFEQRTGWAQEPDPQRSTWAPRQLQLSRPADTEFRRSVHLRYPSVPSWLNKDEMAMALALDAVDDGVWMRNPHTANQGGYGIPMPVQVAGSNAFFPDFLWWIDGVVWAIDTTGVHILGPKVRGKLLALEAPRIALATKGKVSDDLDTLESKDGWTLVLPSPGRVRRSHHADLSALLAALRQTR